MYDYQGLNDPIFLVLYWGVAVLVAWVVWRTESLQELSDGGPPWWRECLCRGRNLTKSKSKSIKMGRKLPFIEPFWVWRCKVRELMWILQTFHPFFIFMENNLVGSIFVCTFVAEFMCCAPSGCGSHKGRRALCSWFCGNYWGVVLLSCALKPKTSEQGCGAYSFMLLLYIYNKVYAEAPTWW